MPHSPAATAAHSSMSGSMTHAGNPEKVSTAQVAPTPPRANCPSAPIFHTFMRKATDTPSEHRNRGRALSSVSSRGYSPPKPPANNRPKALSGALP